MHTHVLTYAYLCMHVNIHALLDTSLHVYAHTYILYVGVCVYIYIYRCTLIHTHKYALEEKRKSINTTNIHTQPCKKPCVAGDTKRKPWVYESMYPQT